MSAYNIHASFLGEKGKTIFYYPFPHPEKKENINEIVGYIRKMAGCQSDRLFVILSDMIIENYLDKILHLLIRNYENQFLNQGFFSFSKKLDLVYGFGLIPTHILDSAKIVNEIRNKFEHNLSFDSFADLDKGLLDKILEQGIKIKYTSNSKRKPPKALFENLVLVAMLGLKSYLTNVNLFAMGIRTDSFFKYLEALNNKALRGM